MPLLLSDSNRSSLQQVGYKLVDIFKISSTFAFVCIAWIFFRADSLKDAWIYFTGMIDFSDLSYDLFIKNSKYSLLTGICFLSIFWLLQIEWKNVKNNNYEIQLNKIQLITLICMIFFMGAFKNQLSFIYFQF
jgi:D-alanyl-lipoteichoic acid acyltransferase DltB (MBOAT superfamily)